LFLLKNEREIINKKNKTRGTGKEITKLLPLASCDIVLSRNSISSIGPNILKLLINVKGVMDAM
jgi:hypothetical protein